MPIATIDKKGTEIYYIDSGPPPHMLIYTTIVITHGLIVNGAAYQRTLPLAGRHGLRIIAMNNRDYRGSTPYTNAELADFVDPDVEVQAAAVRRWGRETARFLRYVCEALRVPRARNGAGGVVLMAEGVGNTSVLAMFGDPRTMGAELSAALAPYLRKVLLFDSSSPSYGIYPDTSLTWPIADEDLPIESTAEAFVTWSSAFYVPWPSVAGITTKALPTHAKPLLVTPSLRKMPMEDVERMTDFSVTTRSALVMAVDVEIMQRHAWCAFMNADAVLPDVEMVAMWCDSAVWVAVWGAKVVDGFMKEEPEPGKRKRSIELVKIENSNHFPHLEEPERLVRLLAKYCRPSTSHKG